MSEVSDYRQREESITLEAESHEIQGAQDETHELLTLNIGPHHPPRTGCSACW